MYVAIDEGRRENDKNLAERTITTAERTGTGEMGEDQIAIHWPAGASTYLQVGADGTWTTQDAPVVANVVPEGFEYNPKWPDLGSKSIIIGGRILSKS